MLIFAVSAGTVLVGAEENIEKFDELNRLKTEFISSVSHEIRTPMNSIHGMSEILRQGKVKERKAKESSLQEWDLQQICTAWDNTSRMD